MVKNGAEAAAEKNEAMDQNICKFVPVGNPAETLSTINFVYETEYCKLDKAEKCRVSPCFVFNLVTDGSGILFMQGREFKIKKGDIFFIFPSVGYRIAQAGSLKCVYISYVGLRANRIMDNLRITAENPVYEGHEKYINMYMEAFSLLNETTLDMMSESLLLYGFSIIGKEAENKPQSENLDIFLKIKRYVDENFPDCTLSLESLCDKFKYNKKYISKLFKLKLNVGFKDYLTMLRIQHACALMKDEYVSVKNVAFKCGFTDQLYFSKVFKAKTQLTPKEYIRSISVQV